MGDRRLEVLAPGLVAIRERDPRPTTGEQVVVRLEYCGICSSDLGSIGSSVTLPSQALGHEAVGVVEQGRGIVPEGRYVVQTSEGFSERITVTAEHLVAVPNGLEPQLGAFAEPVACCLLAVERSVRAIPPEHALVIGAGFMGLVIVRLLVARGISVEVMDPDLQASERAMRLGADRITDIGEEQKEAAFDLVFECVGVQAALDTAVRSVAIGGVLSIVGYHQSAEGIRSVHLKTLNFRGVDLINAHERDERRIRGAMRRALTLMKSGLLDPIELLAGIVDLSDLPQHLMSGGRPGKYIVRCTS